MNGRRGVNITDSQHLLILSLVQFMCRTIKSDRTLLNYKTPLAISYNQGYNEPEQGHSIFLFMW